MNSSMVLWLLVWIAIIMFIRFRLKSNPLRIKPRKTYTANPVSLQVLQQYWTSRLPLLARNVADIESPWIEAINCQDQAIVNEALSATTIDMLEVLHDNSESSPDLEYMLSVFSSGRTGKKTLNKNKSLEWLYSAAENGHARSIFELGQREILVGISEPEGIDLPVALAYFTRASEKQLAEARFMLANVLMADDGAHSREEILETMSTAAELDHPVACFVMALTHLIDENSLFDKEKSQHYFDKVHALKYPVGQAYYGELLMNSELFDPDYSLAYELLDGAREGGYCSACIPLGKMYEQGHTKETDLKKALAKAQEYYRSAAAQGNFLAFQHLLRLYKNGLATPEYDQELNFWFRFETAETSKYHLATHFYLAWLYINETDADSDSLQAIEHIIETLHLPFEEFDFDESWNLLQSSSKSLPYSGFLQWLISDLCESEYRPENSPKLEHAAQEGLRVAQLVICDPYQCLGLDCTTPDIREFIEEQASAGCAAASYNMFEFSHSENLDAETIVLWLDKAAAADHNEALFRLACLKLDQLEYSEQDQILQGVVARDIDAGIKYLKRAIELQSTLAVKILEELYFGGIENSEFKPDWDIAKYYHRYGIINFGEEEQYVQSFVKSLVRIEEN